MPECELGIGSDFHEDEYLSMGAVDREMDLNFETRCYRGMDHFPWAMALVPAPSYGRSD